MTPESNAQSSLSEFAKRVAIAAGIVLLVIGLAVFFWTVSDALLVLFSAILFGVMLDGLTRLVLRVVRMPRHLALTVATLGVAVIVAGIFFLGGMRIVAEAPTLQQSMELSVQRIQHDLGGLGLTPAKLKAAASSKGVDFSTLVHGVGGRLFTSFEVGADILIIIVAGIYFAARPGFYLDAPIKLVPQRKRERLREVAGELGRALRRWMTGRFISMLAVGFVTGIGLTLLGVKLAILLAIIACLMTAVPYLGTIISLFPAVLIALLDGPMMVVYVVLLFLGAHALESYIVSPLIQSRTVHLAPGWLILAQLVGGLAAGIFGILIATPLAVTLIILVQRLYVEDVLGDRVRVLGG